MIATSKQLAVLLGTAAALALAGCGGVVINAAVYPSSTTGTSAPVAAVPVTTPPVTTPPAVTPPGHVHSGLLPVSGATIKLYAAGASGYGSASTSLLQTAVTTGTDGGFTIAGDYTCPANALVYVVATGGSTGSQSNTVLAMMAGLGPCSSLTGTTTLEVNELTTVASVWALSAFMSSPSAVGTSAANAQGLTNAFAAIQKIVSVSAGTMPGAALPAGASLPISNIDTIANVLAACVNSANQAGGTISAACSTLFADTTAGSSSPADTLQAALNMAQNPVLNLTALTSLANSAGSPYLPSLGTAAPASWQIAINYVGGGLSAPSAIATDTAGNVWITNSGNNSVTELNNGGAAISGAGGFTAGGINSPTAIALDSNDTAWIANGGNDTLTHLDATGATGTTVSGGGLSRPSSLAIDQNGDVWVGNAGNSSLSEFTAAGVSLSGASGDTGGGLNQPVAIAIQQ